MSFDLQILIKGQKKPSKFQSNIEIINETQEILRYSCMWEFMSSIEGVMYSIGKTEDGLFNALPIIDTNFKFHRYYPYWIENRDVLSNLTPLFFKEKYEHHLKKLIIQMINESPVKTILFFTRYQGGEKEIICGVLSLDEFFENLNKKKILFNVCYIIQA